MTYTVFNMKFNDFLVGPDDCGRRFDRIIRKFLPNLPISLIYKNIRTGFIRVNNKKQKQEYKITENDVINIAVVLLAETTTLQQTNLKKNFTLSNLNKLEILFKNEHFIVINKPYDIPVQGTNKTDVSLDRIIQSNYQPLSNSLTFTPGPLHRLDKRTTGVLVFSQSLKGAQWFSKAIKSKLIQKEYISLLCGHLQEKVRWCDYIDDSYEYENDDNFRKIKIIAEQDSLNTGKMAITNAEPLAYAQITTLGKTVPVTLTHFSIETGRTHQIRAQSAFHGYPVAGDIAYTTTEYTNIKLKSFGIHDSKIKTPIPEFLLHAIQLKIPENNKLGLPKKITAPIPPFFSKLLDTYFASYDFSLIL